MNIKPIPRQENNSFFRCSFLITLFVLILNVGWRDVPIVAKDGANEFANRVQSESAPNVLLILADDLGFSDLGCYGGEIQTPNLDALASGGLRFTDFYNTGRCWPTRSSLMTGYYPQQVGFDVIPGNPPIRRSRRPAWAGLLPGMLRGKGYRSYHSGKWHLDGGPTQNGGFDRSYCLNDHGRFFSPNNHLLDGKKLPKPNPTSGYYATTSVADHAIKFLKDHHEHHGDKPFFQFVAFTAPHFPLHALPEDIEKYKDVYDIGWNEIRQQRWNRIQKLKIVSGKLSKTEPEVGAPYKWPKQVAKFGEGEATLPVPWDQLTEKQKSFQARKMAIHAAMVDRMDQEIGRILNQLREQKQFENTLILFLSDNGASAELMVRDDGHDITAEPGSWKTHLCLGPGWSNACNTPFRRHKSWVHEGGIRTPLIAHFPDRISRKGQLDSSLGHVIDVVPTVLELAGVDHGQIRNVKSSQPALPGQSLLTAMSADLAGSSGNSDANTESLRTLWWCHEGNTAFRQGVWKIVRAKGGKLELFDMKNDPTEQNDLSSSRAAKFAELKGRWESQTESYRKLAEEVRRNKK